MQADTTTETDPLAAAPLAAKGPRQGPLPGNFDPLWRVPDVARYLSRSERWVWDALTADPARPGSLPFIRIPGGRGSHGDGSPRFVPGDVVAWVELGCPPADAFRALKEGEKKMKRKSA